MSHTAVFCIATSYAQADRIVERLQGAGFPASEISVAYPEGAGKHDIGHVKATKAPEGATTGAAAGGVAGGIVGLLAGIGALAIPGLGPFIAAGPIMAALSGIGAGAATGGLLGGLIGLGIPEIEAKIYEEKLRTGNFLISVHAHNGDEKDRAESIFKDAQAENISSVSQEKPPKP